MSKIKHLLSDWNAMRIFRLVMALIFGLGYVNTNEIAFLVVSLVLLVFALLNVSCPGGSCSAPQQNNDDLKTNFDIKEYKPNKDK